jgi:hypothetical protein
MILSICAPQVRNGAQKPRFVVSELSYSAVAVDAKPTSESACFVVVIKRERLLLQKKSKSTAFTTARYRPRGLWVPSVLAKDLLPVNCISPTLCSRFAFGGRVINSASARSHLWLFNLCFRTLHALPVRFIANTVSATAACAPFVRFGQAAFTLILILQGHHVLQALQDPERWPIAYTIVMS